MNFLADQTVSTPADMLRQKAQNALSNALDAERKGLRTYESLKNVGEDIGTEYGDRVLFELIQNAHDAHADDDDGGIAIKLVTTSKTDGRLIVANRGCGFRDDDRRDNHPNSSVMTITALSVEIAVMTAMTTMIVKPLGSVSIASVSTGKAHNTDQ